jgi:hypothetical protein
MRKLFEFVRYALIELNSAFNSIVDAFRSWGP